MSTETPAPPAKKTAKAPTPTPNPPQASRAKTPAEIADEGRLRRQQRTKRLQSRRLRHLERKEKKAPNRDPKLEELEAQVGRWVQAQVDSGRHKRTKPIAGKSLSAVLAYFIQQSDLFWTQRVAMDREVQDARLAREAAEARASKAEAELSRKP